MRQKYGFPLSTLNMSGVVWRLLMHYHRIFPTAVKKEKGGPKWGCDGERSGPDLQQLILQPLLPNSHWEAERESDGESCWGQFVRLQRQLSDYFLSELTMSLTTAGVQQISYSSSVFTRAYCALIHQQATTTTDHYINCSQFLRASEYIITHNMHSR